MTTSSGQRDGTATTAARSGVGGIDRLLDRFLAHELSLDDLREEFAETLCDDLALVPLVRELLLERVDDARLPRHLYETLSADLDRVGAEATPTESQIFLETLDAPSSTSGRSTGSAGGSSSGLGIAVPPTVAERAPPAVGDVLRDRFVLNTLLKTGSMGVVYKALDKRRVEASDTDPWVVLKLISPRFQGHPGAYQALFQEARKCQQLAHPNIVRVFDVDRDEQQVYMVMEWLDGQSLDQWLLRKGATRPERSFEMIAGIGRALSHAHAHGIVHADVKPGNIFIERNGSAKLLDFGIARSLDAEDRAVQPPLSSLNAWTPLYASCQVLDGAIPDPRDDVYSLACVSYELLTGARPFGKQTAAEAHRQGLHPAPIGSLTATQWQSIERALSPLHDDRPDSVANFIQGIAGGEATQAAKASPIARSSSLPWWIAAMLAGAVVSVLIVIDRSDEQSTVASSSTVVQAPVIAPPVFESAGALPETTDAEPATPDPESPPELTPDDRDARIELSDVAPEAAPGGAEMATLTTDTMPGGEANQPPVVDEQASAAVVRFAQMAFRVSEAAPALLIELQRQPAAVGQITIGFRTRADTAIDGEDFVGNDWMDVNFAAEQMSQTLMVPIIGDAIAEQTETFHLEIADRSTTGSELLGAVSVTIEDDDRQEPGGE